jgi:hypothetical protein
MTPEQTLQAKALRARSDHSEIFKYVIDHLRRQGTPSFSGHRAACAYRGDGDTMCAVGALITDDEYNPIWEGNGIDQLLKAQHLPPDLHESLAQHEQMLLELQSFHDEWLVYEDRSFEKLSENHVAALREKWSIQ